MSLEAALAENIATNKALIAVLTDTNAINKMIADNQTRMLAGQDRVIALASGKKEPTTTRAKKDTAPATTADTTTATSTDATSKIVEETFSLAVPADVAGLQTYISTWTAEASDLKIREARVALLRAIAAELGVPAQFTALFPHAKKVVWFIERDKAGMKIDFKADNDFDTDPAEGGEPAEAAPAAAAPVDDF